MDLNLNKGISKKSNFIQDFISELEKALEGKEKEPKNNLTTEFRDKFLVKRNEILNNYYLETTDLGQMYYIYSQNSNNKDSYNLSICEKGKQNQVLTISKSDLPSGAGIGNVLRNKNNKVILDEKGSLEIAKKLEQLEKELILEQNKFLENKRIENHIYEISEIDKNSVWLFDLSLNSDEAFEENLISKDILKSCNEGDKLIFKDSKYIKK